MAQSSQVGTVDGTNRLTDEEVNLFLDWKKARMERIINLEELCEDINTKHADYGDVLLSSKRKGLFGNVSALVSTLAAPFSGGLSLIGVTGSVGLFVNSFWNDYQAKGILDTVASAADKLLTEEEDLLAAVIDIVNRLQNDDDTDASDFVEVYLELGSDDAGNMNENDGEWRTRDELIGICQPPSAVAIGAANLNRYGVCLKSAEEVAETACAARKAKECAKAATNFAQAAGGLKSAGEGTKAIAEATNVVNQASDGMKVTSEGVKYAAATVDALKKATDGTQAVAETAKVAQEAITTGQMAKEGVLATGACMKTATQAIQNSASAGQLAAEGISVAGEGTIAATQAVQNAANAGQIATGGASMAQNTATLTLQNVSSKLAGVSKFGLALNAIFIPVSVYQLISHEHPDEHPKVMEIRQKIIRLLNELQDYNSVIGKPIKNIP